MVLIVKQVLLLFFKLQGESPLFFLFVYQRLLSVNFFWINQDELFCDPPVKATINANIVHIVFIPHGLLKLFVFICCVILGILFNLIIVLLIFRFFLTRFRILSLIGISHLFRLVCLLLLLSTCIVLSLATDFVLDPLHLPYLLDILLEVILFVLGAGLFLRMFHDRYVIIRITGILLLVVDFLEHELGVAHLVYLRQLPRLAVAHYREYFGAFLVCARELTFVRFVVSLLLIGSALDIFAHADPTSGGGLAAITLHYLIKTFKK